MIFHSYVSLPEGTCFFLTIPGEIHQIPKQIPAAAPVRSLRKGLGFTGTVAMARRAHSCPQELKQLLGCDGMRWRSRLAQQLKAIAIFWLLIMSYWLLIIGIPIHMGSYGSYIYIFIVYVYIDIYIYFFIYYLSWAIICHNSLHMSQVSLNGSRLYPEPIAPSPASCSHA